MASKYFIDSDGKFLGVFDGAEPPNGSIEVKIMPSDGRYIWKGNKWTIPSELVSVVRSEKRQAEYNKRGVTQAALMEALIEAFVESRPEKLDALQNIRNQVKTDIP